MWNRLLVLLGLRIDYTDPENAPPAFEGVRPHIYAGHKTLECCRLCGGGWKHPIHDVDPTL